MMKMILSIFLIISLVVNFVLVGLFIESQWVADDYCAVANKAIEANNAGVDVINILKRSTDIDTGNDLTKLEYVECPITKYPGGLNE